MAKKMIVLFIKKIVAMRLKHGTNLRLANIVKVVRFFKERVQTDECVAMNKRVETIQK